MNIGHDAMYGPQAALLLGAVRHARALLRCFSGIPTRLGLCRRVRAAHLLALLTAYGYGAVALYMAAMALITVVSVLLTTETFQGDITETRAEERELIAEGP